MALDSRPPGRWTRLIGELALVVSAAACGGTRPNSTAVPLPDSALIAQARAGANDLGGDLLTMLTRQLASGGAEGAISVCADSAQVRTARHQRSGMSVRRVGTRVRNPLNTPDSLEAAVLLKFQIELAEGRMPAETVIVQSHPGGRSELRYLRPMRVQEACLACHGPADQLSAEVRGLLAARYPADQATGYAVGDLRGAISVRLVIPPTPGS